MNPLAKGLIVAGLVLILCGVFWQFGYRWIPLGRLPGDVSVRRGNTAFYFPLTTCVLLSLLLSIASWILRWLRK